MAPQPGYHARKPKAGTPGGSPAAGGPPASPGWIHPWHSEIDKEFGDTAGQFDQTMLEHNAHERGLAPAEIRSRQPENKRRNTRKTRKKREEAVEAEEK